MSRFVVDSVANLAIIGTKYLYAWPSKRLKNNYKFYKFWILKYPQLIECRSFIPHFFYLADNRAERVFFVRICAIIHSIQIVIEKCPK